MRYLTLLSRLVLGSVFIFSGFVKAVDPLGSAYKFSDYFVAFGARFLEFLALPLAVLLSAFELLLGMALVLGYRRRITYRVVWWFMLFFTLLTLVLALFNPVTDCGCFGDAIILTNWETFLKNVILMVFVAPLFLKRNQVEEVNTRTAWKEWVILGGIYAAVSLFSLWNRAHLPVLDFRPYDVGTNIQEEMEVPEGAAVDTYETELIYRNRETGGTERFTIEDYPTDTAVWEFVSSESRLVSKGYEPPIHDFALMDRYGNDVVDRILGDQGYSLLMIAYDLEEADRPALVRARDWSHLEILADDYSFYAVTSSPEEQVEAISMESDLDYPFYLADEIMLKTVVRSNPGFVLIRNGVIVGKWGHRDFPAVDQMEPGWTELIGNAAVPLGQEEQLLMEAGVYEEFSFGVIDFDRMITGYLAGSHQAKKERTVLLVFILSVLLILGLSHLIRPLRPW